MINKNYNLWMVRVDMPRETQKMVAEEPEKPL
jgi:hypothetical protein